MNRTVRIIIYLVLLTAAAVLTLRFNGIYKSLMKTSSQPESVESGDASATNQPSVPLVSTNPLVATNAGATSLSSSNEPSASVSNSPSQTNLLSATNAVPPGVKVRPGKLPRPRPVAAPEPAPPNISSLIACGGILVLIVIFLGLLAAHDFSHFVAERFHKFILSDEGEGFKAPEYERAEQVSMDGNHLEAIQMMRDYLKKHPRELYVSIRIAEIYEKELGNYLAAALEYEEVLKHRLRPEQWGWAAIHLANLYSGKLNQTGKAVELLRRIDSDYGETTAAVKARSRLSQLEPTGEKEAVTGPAAPAQIEEEPAPPSNLPRGFRPKKR